MLRHYFVLFINLYIHIYFNKSYNICYKLHDTTYRNYSTILLQRYSDEQKTMPTLRSSTYRYIKKKMIEIRDKICK